MEMSGEERIAAPRQQVWEALNDPEILKQCISGCEEMEKTEDGGFAAKVRAKVGPVNARFSGKVTLTNLNPPESYTITGQGSGGAAGFAKGGADVQLEDEGDATLLRYQVNASVGGKLAQIGQRLVKGTAEKYATQFFARFGEIVAGAEGGATAPAAAAAQEPVAAAPRSSQDEPQPARADEAAALREASPGENVPGGATGTPEVESLARPGVAPAARPEPASEPAPKAGTPAEEETRKRGVSPALWIAGVVAAVILLLLIVTT